MVSIVFLLCFPYAFDNSSNNKQQQDKYFRKFSLKTAFLNLDQSSFARTPSSSMESAIHWPWSPMPLEVKSSDATGKRLSPFKGYTKVEVLTTFLAQRRAEENNTIAQMAET